MRRGTSGSSASLIAGELRRVGDARTPAGLKTGCSERWYCCCSCCCSRCPLRPLLPLVLPPPLPLLLLAPSGGDGGGEGVCPPPPVTPPPSTQLLQRTPERRSELNRLEEAPVVIVGARRTAAPGPLSVRFCCGSSAPAWLAKPPPSGSSQAIVSSPVITAVLFLQGAARGVLRFAAARGCHLVGGYLSGLSWLGAAS